MLIKIREKSQGVFAWVILILICVPFALWGIQNYVGGGTEAAVVTVGDKEFFQRDITQAYVKFSQNFIGKTVREDDLKKQSLEKLILDEVLLQHALGEGLVAIDDTAREFIKSLEYFQTDGKFDKKQYQSLLVSQRISQNEFVSRIKKSLIMEQFQLGLTESTFATQKDIDNFFKIQNQKRDVEIISIVLQKVEEQPMEAEIESYYKQYQQFFLTEEQVSIEYIELSLDVLAKQIKATEEQLKNYYDEHQDFYTTKERRKISHMLFKFTRDMDDEQKQLERALSAKQELQNKEFSVLVAEVSDDEGTASKGGDLGLFSSGVMEKAFEEAVFSLKLNEVSDPVKTAFGYHLIKVTELVPGETKSFAVVKEEVSAAYQRLEAEDTFYELAETLTEVSYENPSSLEAVVNELGIATKKTGLFGKIINPKSSVEGSNIISQAAIINAAFSEDVLKGNNSEPVEIGSDRLIVLRMLEHKPAETKELKEVKSKIIDTLLNAKARQITEEKATSIKQAVLNGQTMQAVAEENGFKLQHFSSLTRASGDLSRQVNQAIFKVAKPVDGKTTIVKVSSPSGTQTVINLLAITEGVMSESDKAKQKLAQANIAKAFGQAEFNAMLLNLQANTDIKKMNTE